MRKKMREDLISPHPVSLPFPLENGEWVSPTKLSTSEELFQNEQAACSWFFFWVDQIFYIRVKHCTTNRKVAGSIPDDGH